MIEIDRKYRALLEQFAEATTKQEEAQAHVDELGAERARILAELNAAGLSYRQIAGVLTAIGLPMSASRVQKMVERARVEDLRESLARTNQPRNVLRKGNR